MSKTTMLYRVVDLRGEELASPRPLKEAKREAMSLAIEGREVAVLYKGHKVSNRYRVTLHGTGTYAADLTLDEAVGAFHEATGRRYIMNETIYEHGMYPCADWLYD